MAIIFIILIGTVAVYLLVKSVNENSKVEEANKRLPLYWLTRNYFVPVFQQGELNVTEERITISDIEGVNLLDGKFNISNLYRNISTRGAVTSYVVDMELNELNLSKTLKSSDMYILGDRIQELIATWTERYKKYLVQKEFEKINQEAISTIHRLNNILLFSLEKDNSIDFEKLRRKDDFKELFKGGKEISFILFNAEGCPISFSEEELSPVPTLLEVENKYSFFHRMFFMEEIKKEFQKIYGEWDKNVEQVIKENEKREKIFNELLKSFNKRQKEFDEEKNNFNETLLKIKAGYQKSDFNVVEEYCDLVLRNSEYPEFFPKNWVIEYRKDNRILVVEYDLPSPEQIPTVESYKYIQTRDEIVEKHLSKATQKELYDNIIYQICIRTIHELFETDKINALEAVAFNGLVTNINPATGTEETKVIMSVLAKKEEFNKFDLFKVDPKSTFKHLKGISATALIDLAPIPPIINIDKKDKRFVDGRDVSDKLDGSINIAAMHWEDFEHLVRELFEKEFSANGGEVKVTHASRDGGVDAIAFDPDPIRGGKIVIQAKRYTNVVGVNAVRDLYGTVMNEGATKGILVTTSDYGKDSYEFAKGKPLTLLNGNNLLALLKKHGHNARINVKEAKKFFNG